MDAAAARGLRRDRLLVGASLIGVAGLAWVWLVLDAARMRDMDPMPSMDMGTAVASPWAAGALVLVFLMWAVMMAGMMLPGALPAILLYAGLVRKRREAGSAAPAAWVFSAGYIAVWTGFSVVAALLQTGLVQARLMTPMMAPASDWLAGGLLVAAGVWQFLPVKDACLRRCRAPLQFFMFRWRPGATGAFLMGAEHGAFCLGCCWALMLLLFAVGIMNLLWVAAIAGFVLVEKLAPGGQHIGRAAGVALVAAGLSVMPGVSLFAG